MAEEAPRSDTDVTGASDHVTLEIIWGKLNAAADEMAIILARSSMSPVVYEVLDFACGICDANAQLLSQANGITAFTGTFQGHVQTVIGKCGESLSEGDIYLVNDPFTGGTHLSDVGVVKPIFAGGELVAFAIAVSHWTELGGTVLGSLSPAATEIYHEGLRFPALRIHRDNQPLEDMYAVIAANVRMPKETLGDINASVASVNVAEARIQELFKRYGREAVVRTFAHLIGQSEKVSRATIAALPDGVYEAEDWIDGTSFSQERVPIRIAVGIAGEDITFDFTGSSPMQKGPYNCSRGALLSAVKTVFKAMVGPHAPSNEGWFRALHVIVPEGTVFSATYPHAVGWCIEIMEQAQELAWKALAPLAPDRFSVGNYMSISATFVCGNEPTTGNPFVIIEPHIGGWGATDSWDGASALIAPIDGDTYNYSIELLEAKYPVRCRRYALNVEGGVGPGRFRGGYGVVREYEILADDVIFYAGVGHSIERPWGLEGGGQGSVNYVEVHSNGGSWRRARVRETPIGRGDLIRIVTGGGGGHGDPRQRSEQAVADDVVDGYLTAEAARAAYHVAIEADGTIDAEATAALRRGP